MKTQKPTIEEVTAFNTAFVINLQEERREASKVLDDLFLKASISHKEHARKVQ